MVDDSDGATSWLGTVVNLHLMIRKIHQATTANADSALYLKSLSWLAKITPIDFLELMSRTHRPRLSVLWVLVT